MLYTRKGDGGTSGLYGTAERFPKNSPVYEALGSVDELNSFVGFCRARCMSEPSIAARLHDELLRVQESLFILQAEIAGAEKRLGQGDVDRLEAAIEGIERSIEAPQGFVIPGATEISALLDCARAICRRAERAVYGIAGERRLSDHAHAYVNRLSSLLYALARYAAALSHTHEQSPAY